VRSGGGANSGAPTFVQRALIIFAHGIFKFFSYSSCRNAPFTDRNILSRGIVEILKTDGDRNCVLSPLPPPAYSALAEPIKGNSYYICMPGNRLRRLRDCYFLGRNTGFLRWINYPDLILTFHCVDTAFTVKIHLQNDKSKFPLARFHCRPSLTTINARCVMGKIGSQTQK